MLKAALACAWLAICGVLPANAQPPAQNPGGPALIWWGDSIAHGETASASFPLRLALRNGWRPEDHAAGGSFSCEGGTERNGIGVYGEAARENGLYLLAYGYNETAHYPREGQIATGSRACALAEAAWLAIPDNRKLKPASERVRRSEQWTNNPAFLFGCASSTPDAAITASNVPGPVIVIGMTHWEKGAFQGAYRIDIDGKPVLTNDAQFADTISQPGHTLFFAPYGVLLTNLDTTPHTVSITVLSGVVEWDWMAGGLDALDKTRRPAVYIFPTAMRSVDSVYAGWVADPSDPIPTSSKADCEKRIARCREMYRSLASTLSSAGLNVTYADITGELDPATDLSADGVHPNDAGQAKLEAAAQRIIDASRPPAAK